MKQTEPTTRIAAVLDASDEPKGHMQHSEAASLQLRRWLVSFGSGPGWYPVGEFIALDSTAAIDRAIEIFGCASGYRAEEIPWDAAPVVRLNSLPRRQCP
jgi:hypothetical protein